jgi:hypothetical protein
LYVWANLTPPGARASARTASWRCS